MSKSNIKYSRKGTANTLLLAIIAIVSGILLLGFMYSAYIGLTNKMSVQSCRNSVETHSLVSTGSAGSIFTDIKCPTEELTIKGKDQKKIESTIAEDMHRCWYIWGQGKGQYFKNDGNFCHICAIYTFDDKNVKVDGFIQYLADTPIQVKYPGDTAGVKYTDYLAGSKTSDASEKVKRDIGPLADTDTFSTSQQYATIFVYASGKDAIQKVLEGSGRATAATVGLGGVVTGGAAIGVGVVGFFLVSNPAGWIVLGSFVAYGGYELLTESTNIKKPETVQFIAFRPYTAEELKNLDCEKMEVNQMSNSGK